MPSMKKLTGKLRNLLRHVWAYGGQAIAHKTQSVLRFRADHAAAQDAVFSYVSDDFIKEMGLIPCTDQGDY